MAARRKKRDPGEAKLMSFADPLPPSKPADEPAEELPYPTTKDGKNPWPEILAEQKIMRELAAPFDEEIF